MKTTILTKKLPAFTLTELLVVLVIVGILTMLAMPYFGNLTTKAHMEEAKLQLNSIHTMQKVYRLEHSKYSNDFNEIGFTAPPTVQEEGQANYTYEIVEANNNSYKARASAITDFDGDGILNVWEIDQDQHLVQITED